MSAALNDVVEPVAAVTVVMPLDACAIRSGLPEPSPTV